MTTLSESTVESAALSWLAALGWQVAHGPDYCDIPDREDARGGPNAEADYGQVVWERLLLDALLTKLVSGEL